MLLPGDPDPETPPDAPGPPPGQFVTDPQTVAAIQRIQAITQGQGSTDPIYLLGQAHVRIAQLQESLAVAIQELTRLGTK